jgi:hypothetical protein
MHCGCLYDCEMHCYTMHTVEKWWVQYVEKYHKAYIFLRLNRNILHL